MTTSIRIIIFASLALLGHTATAQDNAGQIYLYVMFHDDNTNGERFRTEMPDMETCLKALESSKMPVPSGTNDYEVMGAMWCGGAIERQYNSTWWLDRRESVNDK